MIRTEMMIACFLAFLDSGLGFGGTILIKYILRFINNTTSTEVEKSEAFALCGLWIVFYVIKVFVREYWIRLAEMSALKI